MTTTRARNPMNYWRMRSGSERKRRRSLLRLLAEGRAERMGGIDPDDPEFAREELQFLQREGEILVVGMAVDIGIELRGKEIAVDHVAFQLGHVDAVGGKTAHRLVERGGQVAHPEYKSGNQRPRSLLAQSASRASTTKRVVLWVSSSISSARISRP